MKITNCLILESNDFTRKGDLKKEAFDAFAKANLVIHNGTVVKTGAALVAQALQQDQPKRVRKAKVEAPAEEPATKEPLTSGMA